MAEYRSLRVEDPNSRARSVLRVWSYFYFSVGRIGLTDLIWTPLGLRALRLSSAPRGAGA